MAQKPTSIEAENADSVIFLSTMQIASIVVDINSSRTLAEQESTISGIHTVKEKHLGWSLYTHLGYFSTKPYCL